MSEDNNGGADLDIFEGLGKKSGTTPAASAPPAPPASTSTRSAPDLAKLDTAAAGKSTMLGIAAPPVDAPPPPPMPPSAAPKALADAAPSSKRTGSAAPSATVVAAAAASGTASAPPPSSSLPKANPPPPPARSSLAALTSSPPTSDSAQKAAAPATSGAKVEMDWDDDDEATHVFDKDSSARPDDDDGDGAPAPLPAAGSPANKATLLGVAPANGAPQASAPPAPPGMLTLKSASAPPPPPGASGPASGVPSTAPVPPPPPGQTTTAPMPMPPVRSPSAPPPSMNPPGFVPAPGHAMGSMPPGAMAAPPPMQSLPPAAAIPSAPPMPRSMEQTQMVPRAGANRTALWAGAAILGVVVAAGVFFLMPRTGRVVVNVADQRGAAVEGLEIYIDGKKFCEAAPCIVDQVASGVHEVKLAAPGYDAPAAKAVTIEAGKDSTIEFTLAASAGQARAGTGLRVAGGQPGVKLFVDGKEIGTLPQELRDVAPGEHKIRIAESADRRGDSDRYAAVEKVVHVSKGEMQDLGQVQLKVVRGKATIQLATPGAKVYIVSGTDRREPPKLPISIDIDTSKSWSLEASKPGYNDFREAINFDDGQAEKTYNIVLEVKGSTATASAPQSAPQPRAPGPAPQAQPAAAAGQGVLNINSLPASKVVLDGKPLGPTPQLNVSVPAGSHKIMFINSDLGLKKTITVSVAKGETKAAFTKLRD